MRATERRDHATGGRRDVHDASVLLCLHRRQHGFDEAKGRRHVRLERRAPLLDRELLESRRARERGVVDENVDAAEAVERGPYYPLGDSVRGKVAWHCERPRTNRFRGRFRAIAVANVYRDRGSKLMQTSGGGESETPGGPCDDGDAIGEVGWHAADKLSQPAHSDRLERCQRPLQAREAIEHLLMDLICLLV